MFVKIVNFQSNLWSVLRLWSGTIVMVDEKTYENIEGKSADEFASLLAKAN